MQTSGHQIPDSNYVILSPGSDPDADSPFTVHPHQIGRRIEVPPFNGSYIPQPHLITFLCNNQLIANIVQIFISTVGHNL